MLPCTALSPHQISFFHENGYLSLPQITTAEEVNWIRDIYDHFFERRVGWENGDFFDFSGTDQADSALTLPQMLDLSRYEPALKQTLFRTHALNIARQLLGPSAELVFEHAILKPAKSGGETPWHQDEAFFPKYTNYQSLTIWMPLQAVNIANGCLDFIPGSHLGPLLPHHRLNHDPRIHGLEAEGVDASQRVTCPVPAGGATIHHQRTLHHADPNRSDEPRRAYALGFGVRSRATTLRTEFHWNQSRATARDQRAAAAQGVLQRYVNLLKTQLKAVLR